MDNLPLELYFEIFNYCDIIDLFIIRLLNKKLKLIVNYYSPKELIFYKSNIHPYWETNADINSRDVWFGSNRSVNVSSFINYSKLRLLNGSVFGVQKLRRLKIAVKHGDEISFEIISSLNMLESLMIFTEEKFYRKTKNRYTEQKLSIDTLKNLKIKSERDSPYLVIDCPNLESLCLECDSRRIEILNSSSIKYLEIRDTAHFKNLSIFNNLEHLYCRHVYHQFPKNVLEIWRKLKIIQVDSIVYRFESFNWLLDFFLKRNSQIVDQNSRDLKVYLKNLHVTNDTQLNNLQYVYTSTDFDYEFVSTNYHQLINPLTSIKRIHYNDIIKLTTTKPEDFHFKFSNIQSIFVRRIHSCNEQLFSEFISNCYSLHELIIQQCFCQISQAFLDQLSSISKLMILKLILYNDCDFKFINKMRYLENLVTNQPMIIDDELKLNNLSYLKDLEFKIQPIVIRIKKNDHDNYNIEISKNTLVNKKLCIDKKKRFDLISLIEKMNELRDQISITYGSKRKVEKDKIGSSKRLKVDRKEIDSDSDPDYE